MDNQEAIRLMRNLPTMCEFTDAYGEPIDSDAYYEAVDIAISALHAQDAPDINVGSMISRQDAIDRINEYIEEYSEIDSDGNHSEKWCAMQEAKMIIENMPSVQPEPCEDAVSRKDCLKALGNMMDTDGFRDGWAVSRANVECMIKSMPSVQPDPNVLEQEYLKGWEDGRKNLLDAVSGTLKDFCSQCGEEKKYNGVMCGDCDIDRWISAIEEMKCTIEGKHHER